MNESTALPEADELLLPGSAGSRIIYWMIILMIAGGLTSLPFIVVDITAQAEGIIRPGTERTAVRSMVNGLIDSVHFRDGDYIERGTLIATVVNNTAATQMRNTDAEIRQKEQWIDDLNILVQSDTLSSVTLSSLVSPYYIQSAGRYQYESEDRLATLRKVDKEMRTTTSLYNDKIISLKEYDDKSTEASKQLLTYQAFRKAQMEAWQIDLARIRSELMQLKTNRNQQVEEQTRFQVKAPVSGTLMGLRSWHSGSVISPGEILCEVSPEGELIAECYLMTRHIAFVQPGQKVSFRVEAFDQNYFSVLTGIVTSVDNDYTLSDNKPVYTVRCKLNTQTLSLNNSYHSHLKKGLSVQARFIITQRKLSELLFDKLSDWLNPTGN